MTPHRHVLTGLAFLFTATILSVRAAAISIHNYLDERTIHNDYTCRSIAHPNPVILLHGLGATFYEDLNVLELYLQSQGYCTFSLTYGDYPAFPFAGGLKPIDSSAAEIEAFINLVHSCTGAAKLDLIGHSEGGFLALYVPKFRGVAPILDKLVAIAPPTRGTTFAGLYNLAYVGGNSTRKLFSTILDTVGCAACDEIGVGGSAVARLNDGKPIVQPGNSLTVIMSKFDELVTPTSTAFVEEQGVNNLYVQDYCPLDPVGHIGEAYDTNVWNLVVNSLDSTPHRTFTCSFGSPGR
ncbi:secreted lipase [Rhexocercosporidium sp. MPI-PUGE-AT-0058]|nr:secreted lipase [Rhexocercosporidium sp. MPI-PUGE-AT-0058]